jgi:ubiquinone biosynthesis protein
MIAMMDIDHFLPDRYAKFQPVLLDSLVFILSELSLTRMTMKIVDQIRLPQSATSGMRLNILIKDMPTIQKLGQVICRSPALIRSSETH